MAKSLTDLVTISPIELSWTAKKIPKKYAVKIEFAVALLLAVLLSVSICESRVGGTSHVLELSGLSEIWRLLLRLLSDNSDLLEELTLRESEVTCCSFFQKIIPAHRHLTHRAIIAAMLILTTCVVVVDQY